MLTVQSFCISKRWSQTVPNQYNRVGSRKRPYLDEKVSDLNNLTTIINLKLLALWKCQKVKMSNFFPIPSFPCWASYRWSEYILTTFKIISRSFNYYYGLWRLSVIIQAYTVFSHLIVFRGRHPFYISDKMPLKMYIELIIRKLARCV